MNPYEASTKCDSTSKRLSSSPRSIFAGLCTLAGLWIAAPGLIYMNFSTMLDTTSYGGSVSLFGIFIDLKTAQLLTFGAAPILLVASLYIVQKDPIPSESTGEDGP